MAIAGLTTRHAHRRHLNRLENRLRLGIPRQLGRTLAGVLLHSTHPLY